MKSLLWASAALAVVDASTLTPPVLPLIVRNPYLSTWLQDARTSPWSRWPMFWTGEEIGFSIMAKAAGSDHVFPLLGRPYDSLGNLFNVTFPEYKGATFDASTTNLSYVLPTRDSSSDVEVILSFLSPITPTSTFRQAIPASYLTVHVSGKTSISIYLDINGQWVSGDRGSKIRWSHHATADSESVSTKTQSIEFQRDSEQILTEIRDRSEWGTIHFIAPADADHEIGVSAQTRKNFAKNGKLSNQIESNFRGIMDEEPIFAFSKSFNLSSSEHVVSHATATFTIAYIQEPVIQFASARGLTLMRPLWQSYFATAEELLDFHYRDLENTKALASNYSATLAKDAYASGSDDYKDIVELSARQVLGATQFAGTPENPLLFLKEISSDGNLQTIDVIFPAFPFFLYTNPRWLAYLLEPLLEHTLSGQYPNDYAMHDLGAHFPNATGHPDGRDEYMPVEECGNILIMGLALVNSLVYDTGSAAAAPLTDDSEYISNSDQSVFALKSTFEHEGIKYLDQPWGGPNKGLRQAQDWIKRSYKLWHQWTGYLVEYSLEPANQLSTDDFAGWLALQTNLALKGIIGIKAMAGIAKVVNYDSEYERYENISRTYIAKWEEFGISRDGTHAKLSYNWFGSWTTLYNLYADALLCFHMDTSHSSSLSPPSSPGRTLDNHQQQQPLTPPIIHSNHTNPFVPRHIYKMQSTWYSAVRQRFGLPLDSRHLYTKSDWEIFAAAVSSRAVRKDLLQSIAFWVNETSTDRPLTDLYETEDGGYPGPHFMARPVVGGHFSVLTLERACGGKAMDGLAFLEEEVDREHLEKVAVAAKAFKQG